MRRGRETFGWNVFRKRHNDKTRFLPPSLPLHQPSRQGVVCAACRWRAESNSSASLQMVSSPGTSAGSWSVPASSREEGRAAGRLGESVQMLLTRDATSCGHPSLPFLHTAEEGKANAAIPKDWGGSRTLKLRWTFRQLLLCLPQSKDVLRGPSIQTGCCIRSLCAKAFVLSGGPGSGCNGAWL